MGIRGGGVIVLGENVGVTLLWTGDVDCASELCNLSSACAMYRRRGFGVTVMVLRGLEAVIQISVWPVTVVVE
jgi:hypothetical protein